MIFIPNSGRLVVVVAYRSLPFFCPIDSSFYGLLCPCVLNCELEILCTVLPLALSGRYICARTLVQGLDHKLSNRFSFSFHFPPAFILKYML
jgi:hypothetical protein